MALVHLSRATESASSIRFLRSFERASVPNFCDMRLIKESTLPVVIPSSRPLQNTSMLQLFCDRHKYLSSFMVT